MRPSACEGIVAVADESQGTTRYRRSRFVRNKADRARTKELIRLVAREMGAAHPEFFVDLALHESTWAPESVHILNPDERANQRAWERHTYSGPRERMLEKRLSTQSARSRAYWGTKRQLAALRRFEGNAYWYDDLKMPLIVGGRDSGLHETRSVWSFGYGLYGHNAVLYVPFWSSDAPPWVLCDHDGIVATIVEVWAARKAARDCAFLSKKDPETYGTDGASYTAVLRRLSGGHCNPRRLGPAWRGIMARSSVPWDQAPAFGSEFPRAETPRGVVLSHMLVAAAEAGLLRSEPPRPREAALRSHVVHRGRGS